MWKYGILTITDWISVKNTLKRECNKNLTKGNKKAIFKKYITLYISVEENKLFANRRLRVWQLL